MHKKERNLRASYELLISARKHVSPNPGFLQQLMAFEDSLLEVYQLISMKMTLSIETCSNPIILKLEIQSYNFMRKLQIKSSVWWLEEPRLGLISDTVFLRSTI